MKKIIILLALGILFAVPVFSSASSTSSIIIDNRPKWTPKSGISFVPPEFLPLENKKRIRYWRHKHRGYHIHSHYGYWPHNYRQHLYYFHRKRGR